MTVPVFDDSHMHVADKLTIQVEEAPTNQQYLLNIKLEGEGGRLIQYNGVHLDTKESQIPEPINHGYGALYR